MLYLVKAHPNRGLKTSVAISVNSVDSAVIDIALVDFRDYSSINLRLTDR